MAFTLSCSNAEKDLDCNRFISGEFYTKAKENIPGFLVTRTDSLQYEKNQSTGSVSTFEIKWLDDCEYELIFLFEKKGDSLIVPSNSLKDSIRLIPSKIRILTIGNGYYVFEFEKKGINFKVRDTVWVNKSASWGIIKEKF